jgi:hypothetical protein
VGLSAAYSRGQANSDITGSYSSFSGGAGATRQIARGTHLNIRVDARQYKSGTFTHYNRVLYRATLGVTFAPKDIPLSLW